MVMAPTIEGVGLDLAALDRGPTMGKESLLSFRWTHRRSSGSARIGNASTFQEKREGIGSAHTQWQRRGQGSYCEPRSTPGGAGIANVNLERARTAEGQFLISASSSALYPEVMNGLNHIQVTM